MQGLDPAKKYVERELVHYCETSKKVLNKSLVRREITLLKGCTNKIEIVQRLSSLNEQITKSKRLSMLLSYIQVQVKNINFLMEIGDSAIIETNPGSNVLLSGRLA